MMPERYNECDTVIEVAQLLSGRSHAETQAAMIEAERRFAAAAWKAFGRSGEWGSVPDADRPGASPDKR